MSVKFKIKRRVATGAAGAPASLLSGELAYNEADKSLYYGAGDDGSGNATSIITIGGRGAFADLTTAQTVAGAKTFSSSPQVPTPASGDSSQNAASTAFVQNAVGAAGGNQAPNTVYSGPATGSTNASPSFRSLVAKDIPSIPSSKLSDAGTAGGAILADSNNYVPLAQIPPSVKQGLTLVGTIAASGSLPSSPMIGQYWIINQAGTFSGTTHALNVGDWIVYDGSNGASRLGASGWDYVDNSVLVSSVFGRMGVVVAQSGDYTSDQVTEGSNNLYLTASRVLAVALTGLSLSSTATISATDTILSGLGKLQAQITANNTAALQKANNLSDLASISTARTNLGLGTMATQNASAVAITGGTIDNVILDGGTF